ncbi:MAG: DUF1961 family protein [Rikenellaceae bacterium]
MKIINKLFIAAAVVATLSGCGAAEELSEFYKLNACKDWSLKMEDSCRENWQEQWFMDGLIATVTHSKDGMDFRAGETYGDDAHHAVLWTKEEFAGDVKIEYNYTRTEEQTVNVNILYIQAQGTGLNGTGTDISKWKRDVPTMKIYYEYMNPLHISYAAFPMVNEDPKNDYLRVRKYPISEKIDFDQMEVEPTFYNIELFKPYVTYKITVIKTQEKLFMNVEGDGREECYEWSLEGKASINNGRIGLRHMYTRAAQYSDFKVYTK